MLLPLLTAAVLAVPQLPAATCTDPATPPRQMALAYDAWPAPPEGKARSTFERLKQYLREPDDSEYRSLVREYQKLAESHRSSTHIQLALGVLYATGPDLNPPGAEGYRNGVKLHLALADDNAARVLSRVAKDDATQWLAPALLTGIAVSTREKARLRQAAKLVENALQHDPDNVAMQLAWSDLLVAQDREDEAAAFWGEHTPVCASELHAEAEALLLTGDSTGAQLYLDALHRAGPDELSRFYDDVRVIFGPEDARAWASTAPEHRAGWLALFWERSAAKSGIEVRSRIAQHVERIAVANQKYRMAILRDRRVAMAMAGSGTREGLTGEPLTQADVERDMAERFSPVMERFNMVPWDDRGIIYVRQGEPDTVFDTKVGSGTRIPRNQTWLYARDTPPWLLSFMRPNDLGPDYYWNFSMGCGFRGSPTGQGFANIPGSLLVASGGGGALEAREFYLELAKYDARFEKLGNACVNSVDAGTFTSTMRELSRYYEPLMRTIASTESALPRFKVPLRMLIAAYAFRDGAGRPEITALTWIPTPELQDSTPTRRLRLTYTLVDSSSAPLRHDTVTSVPASAGPGLLRGAKTWTDVPVDGGNLLVMAMDDDDPLLGTYRNRRVRIPFARTGAAISDLVVGEPDVRGLLVRGDNRISPLPDHAVRSGRDFRLYYEVYGVPAGTEMETSIRVVRNERAGIAELLRLHPGRRDQREISMQRTAEPDARGIVVHDVSVAGDLLPGQYTIAVTIRTAAGELQRTGVLNVDQ